jgi:hypothetical protein
MVREQIRKLWAAERPAREIAELLKVKPQYVYNIVHRYGPPTETQRTCVIHGKNKQRVLGRAQEGLCMMELPTLSYAGVPGDTLAGRGFRRAVASIHDHDTETSDERE